MAVAAPYKTTDRSVAVGDRGMQKRITNLIASRWNVVRTPFHTRLG